MDEIGATGFFLETATPQSGRVRYEIHDHATVALPEDRSPAGGTRSCTIPFRLRS